MPEIQSGESREHYLQRCIPYVVKNEGLSNAAAAGKCEGMYDEHVKRQHAKHSGEKWEKTGKGPWKKK